MYIIMYKQTVMMTVTLTNCLLHSIKKNLLMWRIDIMLRSFVRNICLL